MVWRKEKKSTEEPSQQKKGVAPSQGESYISNNQLTNDSNPPLS
ncbi:MAG: hypothetical protein V5A88_01875 [Candidatus Thermoplasmatota archaeon]